MKTNTHFDVNQMLQTVVSFMERTTNHIAIHKMLAFYEATADAIKADNRQAARAGYDRILDLYDLEINR